MQSFDVFPKKAIFLFLNGLLKKNAAATTAAAAAYNSLAKSFVLSILSIDVKPLFSPLTALKMALLDMMKGLSSQPHGSRVGNSFEVWSNVVWTCHNHF